MRTSFRFYGRWVLGLSVAASLLLPADGRALAVPQVLTFVEALFAGPVGAQGMDNATAVAVSADGLNVYVVGASSGLAVFSRNIATGELSYLEAKLDGIDGVQGLFGIVDVAISPDGKHVYTAALAISAVAIFSRAVPTGTLTYAGHVVSTAPGVTGLTQTSSVVVSPDNEHVYATGRIADGVVVFDRNTTTGALTFLESKLGSGPGAIPNLDGPNDVAISPDGLAVVVASQAANALVAFNRNATSGLLTYADSEIDNTAGADGLANANAVAISPDGLHIYTTSPTEAKVGVFARTVPTGTLSFVEAQANGIGGVPGLLSPVDIVTTPDGENVYASAFIQDDVVVSMSAVPLKTRSRSSSGVP